MSLRGVFFDEEAVGRLFPFYFAFGRDYRIFCIGPSLEKLPQAPSLGDDWREIFALKQPEHTAASFDDLCGRAHELFAFQAKTGDFELKGEMLLNKEGDALLFLGSPVVNEFDDLKAMGLKVGDFSRYNQTNYLSALERQQGLVREQRRNLEELRAAHRALESSELKFRQLTETMREVFWMTNPEKNTMLYISPGYEEIWGRTRQSLYSNPTSWLDAIHPEDRERVMHAAMTKQMSGEYDEEYRIVRPDGSIRWIRDRAYPVRDDQGNVYRVTGIATDVTEWKKSEQARLEMQARIEQMQRLESLGLLAGGIAHDFNNLLAAIVGNAELIGYSSLDSPMVKEHVDAIIASSEKASELCQQMLAYSGQGRMLVEPIDLSAKAREILGIVKASIGKNVELRLDLPETLPAIEADAVQVQQVIMNLVINAAEAIGDSSGIVTIRAGVMHADRGYLKNTGFDGDLEAGEYVFLEVADTGCGMDDETKAKMFEPFFTTKFTGRGMGMSAVLGILRGHRGGIKVDTCPGQGTTIRVLFPVCAREADQTLPQDPSASVDASPYCGTILIIDDEAPVRKTAAMMLKKLGFDSLQAVDGEDGVRKYRDHRDRIRAVLLDMAMPRLDGKGCLRELERINPKVRAVLCSGYTEQEVSRRFGEMSVAGFLRKPFRLRQLEKALKIALVDS